MFCKYRHSLCRVGFRQWPKSQQHDLPLSVLLQGPLPSMCAHWCESDKPDLQEVLQSYNPNTSDQETHQLWNHFSSKHPRNKQAIGRTSGESYSCITKHSPKKQRKTGLKNSWWKIVSYLNQSTFAGMFLSVDFTKIVSSFLFDIAETLHFEKFRAFSFTASDNVFYCRVSQNWQAGSCLKTATDCPFLCFLATINLNRASLAELFLI